MTSFVASTDGMRNGDFVQCSPSRPSERGPVGRSSSTHAELGKP